MEEEKTKELEIIDKRINVPEETAVAALNGSVNDMAMMAMQKGYDPAFIEKMLDLQERYEANEARKAYFEALANFKANAPPVKKDKYNKFFDSWYTSLGTLLDTYNPVLGKYGLSLSFPSPEQTDTTMKATCRLSHRMGHSESMSIEAPIDRAALGKESGKRSRNAIQDIKSTFTYLRSATCEGILGVAGTEGTGDDDGNAAGTEYITEQQVSQITDMINSVEADEGKFLLYLRVDSLDKIPAIGFEKAMAALKAKERKPGEDG